MKTRIISALVLVLICFPPLYFGGLWLDLLLGMAVLLGCYEFCTIRKKRFNWLIYSTMALCVLCGVIFYTHIVGVTLFYLIVLFFLAICFADISLDDICATYMMTLIFIYAVTGVRNIYADYGFYMMLYILIAAFGCDIAALFTGMMFGKHKLNERISPKKTVEGAIGGWLIGFLASFVYAYFMQFFGIAYQFILFASLALPIVAQIGDLSFSLIKRNYGVKDFGSIIPGHGGILDRIDSLLFCLIFLSSMVNFL